MQTSLHLEMALRRMQQIIAAASQPAAPITEREALSQITEELELAGFGVLEARAEVFLEPGRRPH
jgi:hypothetical protein